jgi:dipeptidase E
MTAMRLLLLSNSTSPEGEFLRWAEEHLQTHLGTAGGEIAFVPYASVVAGYDAAAERVAAAMARLGWRLRSVHDVDDPAALLRDADAIAVSGGNTFQLLASLYAKRLLDPIRERVAAGAPYVGWSAGSVVACPTMRTTNDMPIVEPPSLGALGLVAFQINAHYTDFHPPGFRGETRAERLAEFVALNPGVPVLGLPEGTMVLVRGTDARVLGTPTSAASVRVFGVPGVESVEIGALLPFLAMRA